MTKCKINGLWKERYGNKETVMDYAGREMRKADCEKQNSPYQPTLDHILPTSMGGKDTPENIEICNRMTNQEKDDNFPYWKANKQKFKAEKVDKGYKIIKN